MRQALANNLHNPFYNRFQDPVTQRRDEMQAYENVIWLRERNEGTLTNSAPSTTIFDKETNVSNVLQLSGARIFAGLFALLLVLLVSVSVLKGF